MQNQANAQAAQQTAAAVAGIRAEQDRIRQQAAQQALMTNQAAQASARLLQGLNLGGLTAQDYANSAAAERAGAAGYSGGLQQTVGDAAAQVQHDLSAAGSPQQALNQSQAAGNVLYGLGGQLPANQLDAAGPLVAAQQRALPAQTLGYGQAVATGLIGAGQQRAEQYNSDILAARAKQAGIAADYFAQLSEDARKRGQDAVANAYKALGAAQTQNKNDILAYNDWYKGQISAFNANGLADYRSGMLDINTTRANNTAAYQQGQLDLGNRRADIANRNADIAQQNANKPENIRFITDSSGRKYTFDPNTGNVTTLPGNLGKPRPSTTTSGGITASQTRQLGTQIRGMKNPKPVNGTTAAPTGYNEALNATLSSVPNTAAWKKQARRQFNGIYGSLDVHVGNWLKAARKKQPDWTLSQMVTYMASVEDPNDFTLDQAAPALAKAYNFPVEGIRAFLRGIKANKEPALAG